MAFSGTAIAQPSTNPNANSQTTNTAFPDIQNHWARPFIQRLAERNILAGYLDGTFRPNQSVNRDEFAAIIRQAFSQAPERQIASGSVYRDVPSNYWAAPAIEEAYQMGFMHGYPGRVFRPEQPVSRVEAIVSLAQNLNLNLAQSATTAQAVPQQAPRTQARRARRRGTMPLAMGALMQPLFALQAQAKQAAPVATAPTPPATTAASQTTPQTTATNVPVSQTVTNYYADADRIPKYAVDEVAQATRAGMVVNHPETNLLRPRQPATRGEIAALIHQALVTQGRMAPIDQNLAATNYIVEPQNR